MGRRKEGTQRVRGRRDRQEKADGTSAMSCALLLGRAGWELRAGCQLRPLARVYLLSCRMVINIPKKDKARDRAKKADLTHERTAQRGRIMCPRTPSLEVTEQNLNPACVTGTEMHNPQLGRRVRGQ